MNKLSEWSVYMKRILIRSGMNPLVQNSINDVVCKDWVGTNIGNMLFPYSIIRGIMKDGDVIDNYSIINEKDYVKINAQYDMFVIPLANAFREDFIVHLNKLTNLVKRLTIPCVVVGVGLQTSYEPNLKNGFRFDADVKAFMNAVLEKSTSVGVRGEITQKYLMNLGFTQNQVKVIGCPSMYCWGATLPIKMRVPLSYDSHIGIGYNPNYTPYHDWIAEVKKDYSNYHIIVQGIKEMRLLYAGDEIVLNNIGDNPNYIRNIQFDDFINNRLRSFTSVSSWLAFNKEVDLTITTRIHGAIASILSGTQTMLFCSDSRTRELAEYHNIVHYHNKGINGDMDLRLLYEKSDFSCVQEGHIERYKVYQAFMRENGIDVYNQYSEMPFERVCLSNVVDGTLECYSAISSEKQRVQFLNYLDLIQKKINWWEKQPESNQKNNGLEEWRHSQHIVKENYQRIW